jgi:hypothetical protein
VLPLGGDDADGKVALEVLKRRRQQLGEALDDGPEGEEAAAPRLPAGLEHLDRGGRAQVLRDLARGVAGGVEAAGERAGAGAHHAGDADARLVGERGGGWVG